MHIRPTQIVGYSTVISDLRRLNESTRYTDHASHFFWRCDQLLRQSVQLVVCKSLFQSDSLACAWAVMCSRVLLGCKFITFRLERAWEFSEPLSEWSRRIFCAEHLRDVRWLDSGCLQGMQPRSFHVQRNYSSVLSFSVALGNSHSPFSLGPLSPGPRCHEREREREKVS